MNCDSCSCRVARGVRVSLSVVAVGIVALGLLGCATPGGAGGLFSRSPGFTDGDLKEAVANDSFPTAAELGIAARTDGQSR